MDQLGFIEGEEVFQRGVAMPIPPSNRQREVADAGSSLVTRCWLGLFKADPLLRQELLLSLDGDGGEGGQ